MRGRNQHVVHDMVNLQDNVPVGDTVGENRVDVVDEAQNGDGVVANFPKRATAMFGEETEFEPCNGIEFESHEAAYSFYQEYAKSMGFTTSIKNSRRSKKSKEFIDAKFACSRYGVTPESDASNSRRSSVKKTDCKASMHVKRRPDGKWIIHEFVKEHNHELLPALAYHFRIHRNVQLNLMEPPHDGYYVNQQSMQGLGQLNSIAPGHDSFFGTQQSINTLGQYDFRPPTTYIYNLQDDSHLRSSHMHGNAPRHE
ncbi:hypothetical protein RCOM_1393220 [Ricinus communis]|uniref:FAR1 domain-containing protein n=1 Tax=Ricinus communis TaxID=3988 RepID=B9S4Z1_RICCO|nr:hypothetical protein RCOM_1393220 [Ricinus communis]